MPKPLAVAITGGIGAGKSSALEAFARHGAAVVSSDDIVHRLLQDDEDVRTALVARFGDRILDGDGNLDRGSIGDVVFSDRDQLAWLESLLHPLVVREYLAWREALAQHEHPPAVCATEVPLLYEVGGEGRFDAVVVVTAPRELRASRASVPLEARERRLIPDEEKMERADFAYVNDGTPAELDAFVEGVMKELEARV